MENTKKVFISLPMHGKTTQEIKDRMQFIFDIAKKRFSGELELIDTIQEKAVYTGGTVEPRLWYLGRSISLMSNADIVIFDSHFREAKGCVIEYNICNFYKLMYYILDDSEEVDD